MSVLMPSGPNATRSLHPLLRRLPWLARSAGRMIKGKRQGEVVPPKEIGTDDARVTFLTTMNQPTSSTISFPMGTRSNRSGRTYGPATVSSIPPSNRRSAGALFA